MIYVHHVLNASLVVLKCLIFSNKNIFVMVLLQIVDGCELFRNSYWKDRKKKFFEIGFYWIVEPKQLKSFDLNFFHLDHHRAFISKFCYYWLKIHMNSINAS